MNENGAFLDGCNDVANYTVAPSRFQSESTKECLTLFIYASSVNAHCAPEHERDRKRWRRAHRHSEREEGEKEQEPKLNKELSENKCNENETIGCSCCDAFPNLGL